MLRLMPGTKISAARCAVGAATGVAVCHQSSALPRLKMAVNRASRPIGGALGGRAPALRRAELAHRDLSTLRRSRRSSSPSRSAVH